ncbi:hypothetical protein MSZK_02130 [Mycobacterium sp. shizuoka-1]|nr:hypothetical protein MSZK_02130 [Mycobacterium sp. shizuoka-1]
MVERRRPTRAPVGPPEPPVIDPPFLFGTRCHILAISITIVENLADERVLFMEPNTAHETETELVTETLVEEVSIDGMCGVY